jgi:hypothetical protein
VLAFHTTSPTDAAADPDTSPQRLHSLARAARQAILRRLAPPLRHDMVVHLQSLGLVAEALSARMERGALKAEDLQSGVTRLNRLSRQAVARCLDVCTWMQPSEDDTTGLCKGADEMVRLLSTSLSFRGFALRCEPGTGDLEVSHSALRYLLAAVLLQVTDAAPAPGEVLVRTEAEPGRATVRVEYRRQPEAAFTQPHEAGEPQLAREEVQALAAELGAELEQDESVVVLRLPRFVVTAPLKMVPV